MINRPFSRWTCTSSVYSGRVSPTRAQVCNASRKHAVWLCSALAPAGESPERKWAHTGTHARPGVQPPIKLPTRTHNAHAHSASHPRAGETGAESERGLLFRLAARAETGPRPQGQTRRVNGGRGRPREGVWRVRGGGR